MNEPDGCKDGCIKLAASLRQTALHRIPAEKADAWERAGKSRGINQSYQKYRNTPGQMLLQEGEGGGP